MSYQWRFNNGNIAGAESATYTINNAQPVNAGNYSVVVTNVAGIVTSAVAELTVLTNTTGTQNRVLLLDGIRGYSSVPHSTELNLASGDFSITAWVYLRNYAGSALLTKRAPGSRHGWMIHFGGLAEVPEDKKVSFIVSESADLRVVSNSEIRTNEWHHIAVVYNASNSNAVIYVDGNLDASSVVPPPLPTTSDLYFGRDSKVGQYFFSGYMDEVCVWSRALTDNEVVSRMSCKRFGSESGLLAYWNFDAGTLSDLTGHGHNGMLLGSGAVVPMSGEDIIHVECGQQSRFAGITLGNDQTPLLTLVG